MRNLLRNMVLFLAVFFCASFVSCKNDDGEDDKKPTTYKVSIALGIQNGSVIADKTSAEAGATVTLTATPSNGYELDAFSVKAGETSITVTDSAFTMPASDVLVSATFKAIEVIEEITHPTLPENVGTNVFNGKAWSRTLTENSIGYTDTVTFTSSELTKARKVTATSESVGSDSYNYAYDNTNKILYMAFKSRKIGTTEITTVEDYVNYVKAYYGVNWTDDLEAYYKGQASANYATLETYVYSIDESSNLTITSGYFDGKLPTAAAFGSDYIEIQQASQIKLKDSSTNAKYYIWPSYTSNSNGNGGTFTGKLFASNNSNETIIGDVSGSYTTSGTGTSGSSVTLTFTTLPISISGISTGTAYTLSQHNSGSATFTLQQ